MKADRARVLVIDDEANFRESLAELVESEGFAALEANDGEEAANLLRSGQAAPDVIFLDLRMPRLDGLSLLRLMRDEHWTDAPVVVISAFGDSVKTIEAMRLGAYDYITKPLDLDELLATLRRAAEQRRLILEAAARLDRQALEPLAADGAHVEMIGASRAMREVFKQIGRLAATDATVLIAGESGTGKELAARAIHQHSARASCPFVAINCGALPENLIESELFGHERGAFTGADRQKKGRFELAHTGTLLLDEIGELTPSAQVKLLRILQERRFERVGGAQTVAVDVRIITATNRDLRSEVEEKRFREDLYYRLSVVELRLPPLRARLADVPQLAEYFIERAAERHHTKPKLLSDAALRALLAYRFPGNVRELENMIERAVVTSGGDLILPEHLWPDSAGETETGPGANESFLEMPFKEAVAALERALIARSLEAAGGNRAEAARRLGINRRLLYSKLEEHGLG
ncbi:MAG: sigma-54-dependent Fis family transcriptional regulator [Blastocatellia bacterium]|nr:sigma-54-dependent Fis family transcriptional regulator [Blastocatellia bacterium]